jgi:hypothetical protein
MATTARTIQGGIRMKPILFCTEMVKAILDGRKTVTRRLVKEKIIKGFDYKCDGTPWYYINEKEECWEVEDVGPYQVGDILYVREAWQEVFETEYMDFDEGREIKNIHEIITNFDKIEKFECGLSGNWAPTNIQKRMKYFVFKADDIRYSDEKYSLRWHPSIHMPKEAARIFLRVKEIRVERLQDIDKLWDNYDKEGMRNPEIENISIAMQERFISIWNSTIPKKDPADMYRYGWKANPWVWVIEFERISKEEAYAEGN